MCCVVPALVSLCQLWCHCACSGLLLGFPRLHSLYRPYGQVEGESLAQIFHENKSSQVFTVRIYRFLL